VEEVARGAAPAAAWDYALMIIEPNLDLIRNADWIIDLGREGGE